MNTKAAIDIGSSSVVLVIENFNNDIWKQVFEKTWITGLGSETKRTELLGEKPMSDTLKALKEAYEIAKQHNAQKILAAGTMAVRMAKNQLDFLKLAEQQGTPLIVLSGKDEAEYGFLSVVNDPLFKSEPIISVVDPGGQSTEIVVAHKQDGGYKKVFHHSFPIGTLGLRGGCLHNESVSEEEKLKGLHEIDHMLYQKTFPEQSGQVVVIGAEGTNLMSIREKLKYWQPEKVHGQSLTIEEVKNYADWMLEMTDVQRAKIVVIQPGREKTLHIGTLILERVLYALKTRGCKVSVKSWRNAFLELSE